MILTQKIRIQSIIAIRVIIVIKIVEGEKKEKKENDGNLEGRLELSNKRMIYSMNDVLNTIFASRFKVLLFDLQFVDNFESIFSNIDSQWYN